MLGLVALLSAAVGGYLWGQRAASEPPAETSQVIVRPTPNTIVALRALAELQTVEFSIDRVIDIRDKQSRLWGLVEAEDALLMVAGGQVRAGIDLANLSDGAIVTDWEKRRVAVRLPTVKILSRHLDEGRTYVHTRQTDRLAERKESLEAEARRAAEQELERAAISGGILRIARENAQNTVQSLLRSLGFEEVLVTFESEPPHLPDTAR